MRLADFAGGLVAGVKWRSLLTDKEAQAKIRAWVDSGELVCPNEPDDQVDVVASLLYTKDTVCQAVHDPAVNPVAKRAEKQAKPAQLKSVAWIIEEIVFDGGLQLPVGCRVTRFEESQPHKFSSGDLSAARDCADRLAKETGEKPMISAIAGHLRIIRRGVLTDKQPVVERMPVLNVR